LCVIAPCRTARPSTPDTTLRQLFAVAGLTFRLIDRITLSTNGVVIPPNRTLPIAGSRWFFS
jgi:hypothetical protein